MPNKRNQCGRIVTIILTTVCIVIVTSFLILNRPIRQPLQFPTNLGSYLNTGDYEINANTILADLDRGVTNLFAPILATPETSVPTVPNSFPWHEADYLRISNVLYQFVWKESLDNWNLYSMQFNRECQDNLSGFDSAEFTFYRTIKVNKEQVYTARGIGIYPLFNLVSWGGNTNFHHPLIFGWESIDLKKLDVTADDALQIAEQNGGQNARSAVNNNCNIFLTASPNDWYVLYSGEAFSRLFYVRVDAETGRYEILGTKN